MNDFIDDEFMALRRNNRLDRIIANDAIIEEIFIDNGTGFVTISYGVMGDFNLINKEIVTLVVGPETIIRDQFGRSISLFDLREGMFINAEFSSAMTRSIPPQARALRIVLTGRNANNQMKIGRVLSVDTRNGFLYTGNAEDIYSQMRYVITDETIILNRRGNRISLRDLRPGQTVRVEHADFMTMSIPPQTTAFRVEVL